MIGTYLGCKFEEMLCKTKADPNVKEVRVIVKHTVHNQNAIHVYSEFLPPHTVVEKDKNGVITKATLPDRSEKVQNVKNGAEVLVTVTSYDRDGVGVRIMGDLEVVA